MKPKCTHTDGWFVAAARIYVTPTKGGSKAGEGSQVKDGLHVQHVAMWSAGSRTAGKRGSRVLAVCNLGCGAVRTFTFPATAAVQAGRIRRKLRQSDVAMLAMHDRARA